VLRTIDKGKPIWRVVGQLPAPDGRRMTIFCNAESEALARTDALREMAMIESAKLITPKQIAKWESMFPPNVTADDGGK
jgi:hypothetical protein